MKKFIIALLAVGLATTAMARFNVYQVKLTGRIFDEKDDKAFYILNGDKVETWEKLTKKTGRLSGLLLEDEFSGWTSFITIEKGESYQDEAFIDWCLWHPNLIKEVNEEGKRYSYQEKGVQNWRLMFNVSAWDLSFDTALCGTFSWTERELPNENYFEKYVVNMKGSGGGEEGDVCFPVNNIIVRLNSKYSDALYDAFDEAGGHGNEAAGAAAVTDKLNEIINKLAKIENSAAVWPPWL